MYCHPMWYEINPLVASETIVPNCAPVQMKVKDLARSDSGNHFVVRVKKAGV